MNVSEYTLKKIKNLKDNHKSVYSESLIQNLENALAKWSKKNNYMFSFFYRDPGDYRKCGLRNSLPISYSEYYSFITDKGLKNIKKGWYVHIINKDINVELKDYLEKFIKISGEVCFADFENQQLHYRESCYGVVMEGTPTHSFDFDCYSQIDKRNNKRYATSESYATWREEHWLIPSKSKIKALIYNDKTEIEIKKTAEKLGLDTIHLNCIHIEEAA